VAAEHARIEEDRASHSIGSRTSCWLRVCSGPDPTAVATGSPSLPPPIHAVAYYVTAEPEKREELQQTLRSLAAEIRKDPGCVVCAVCIEESGGCFVVVSGWKTDAELQRHLRSEHFRVLSGASRLLGAEAEVGFLRSDTNA
jgi:quinol monooxygenase YgiN